MARLDCERTEPPLPGIHHRLRVRIPALVFQAKGLATDPPKFPGSPQMRRLPNHLPQVLQHRHIRLILGRRDIQQPHAVVPEAELEASIPLGRADMDMGRAVLVARQDGNDQLVVRADLQLYLNFGF